MGKSLSHFCKARAAHTHVQVSVRARVEGLPVKKQSFLLGEIEDHNVCDGPQTRPGGLVPRGYLLSQKGNLN